MSPRERLLGLRLPHGSLMQLITPPSRGSDGTKGFRDDLRRDWRDWRGTHRVVEDLAPSSDRAGGDDNHPASGPVQIGAGLRQLAEEREVKVALAQQGGRANFDDHDLAVILSLLVQRLLERGGGVGLEVTRRDLHVDTHLFENGCTCD